MSEYKIGDILNLIPCKSHREIISIENGVVTLKVLTNRYGNDRVGYIYRRNCVREWSNYELVSSSLESYVNKKLKEAGYA